MAPALRHLRSIMLCSDTLCLPQNTFIEECLVNLRMLDILETELNNRR